MQTIIKHEIDRVIEDARLGFLRHVIPKHRVIQTIMAQYVRNNHKTLDKTLEELQFIINTGKSRLHWIISGQAPLGVGIEAPRPHELFVGLRSKLP